MRNHRIDSMLRSFGGSRRVAFSLAELVVSVGVLTVMLVLAGEVMSLTVKSTGQALAITEINQTLHAFEATIRDDLRQVRRGESVMVIQANSVNAYWSAKGKAADSDGNPANGYPHETDPDREDPLHPGRLVAPRADMLMFFKAGKAESFVHPGVMSEIQQVVYGHASLGEYVPNAAGDGYDFTSPPNNLRAFPSTSGGKWVDPDLVSPVTADGWHLARRTVHLVSETPPLLVPPGVVAWHDVNDPDDSRILLGETDVVGGFDFARRVLVPSRDPCKAVGPPTFGGSPWYLPQIFIDADMPFARSQLDLTPPPQLASRLGHYFLQGCASFKVEWALDPTSHFVGGLLRGQKRILWIDQGDEEDPLRALTEAARRARLANGGQAGPLDELREGWIGGTRLGDMPMGDARYTLAGRFSDDPLWAEHGFGSGQAPNRVAIFTASRLTPVLTVPPPGADCLPGEGALVEDDIFPSALRITIDLMDPQRRLNGPIRHTFVVPVGG